MKTFCSVLLVLACSACLAQVPTNGLISHWPFSGNANDVVGGNNGTVFNAIPSTDRFGNVGCAYNFNGTSSYIVALNAGPTGTLSRSVSFWAKATNTTLTSAFAYGASPDALSIQFNYGCSGIGPDCGSAMFVRSNSNVSNGLWHHYVMVYDNTTGAQMGNMQFYMDGTLLSATCAGSTGTPINSNAAYPINFGKVADNNLRFFKGDLDDYYLYNRALTPAEVLALYNEAQCTSTTAPSGIAGSVTVCPGAAPVYSVAPVAGASSYSWTLPGGWTGSSTTNTISVNVGASSGTITVSAKNCCGYSQPTALSVTVTTCTGLHENKNELFQNVIFPNPNNGNLTVKIPFLKEQLEMEILNSLGQLIYESAVEAKETKLELKLSVGIYFVRISDNGRTIGLQKFAVDSSY